MIRAEPAALGLLLGTGLVLILLSVTVRPAPPEPAAAPRQRLAPRWPHWPAVTGVIVGGLAVAGVIVGGLAVAGLTWFVFRIPVLSGAGFLAVVGPRYARTRSGEQLPSDLSETAATVARWIETVRDYLLTASTLSEAMIRASGDVRGRHREAFARFGATLSGAGGFERAVEDLAGDLDNALADKALVALWIGNREGGDLQAALGLLAESAQVEADNARRIEAGLAGTRRLIKIVLALCMAILVLSLAAFRENYDIYRTAGGQAALAVGLAAVGVTWWSIWRLSTVSIPERLIVVRPSGGRPR